jgi:hypothetical protein
MFGKSTQELENAFIPCTKSKNMIQSCMRVHTTGDMYVISICFAQVPDFLSLPRLMEPDTQNESLLTFDKSASEMDL